MKSLHGFSKMILVLFMKTEDKVGLCISEDGVFPSVESMVKLKNCACFVSAKPFLRETGV